MYREAEDSSQVCIQYFQQRKSLFEMHSHLLGGNERRMEGKKEGEISKEKLSIVK